MKKFSVVQTFCKSAQEIIETVGIRLFAGIIAECKFLEVLWQVFCTHKVIDASDTTFENAPISLYAVGVETCLGNIYLLGMVDHLVLVFLSKTSVTFPAVSDHSHTLFDKAVYDTLQSVFTRIRDNPCMNLSFREQPCYEYNQRLLIT